jgi:LuxR family maltose regulon positive regulatory protein
MAQQQISAGSINAAIAALRFFFTATLAGLHAPQSVDRVFVEQLLRASGADLSRTRAPTVSRPLEPLTDQEKRILIFLAKGVSNKEMASRLFVSENTVKFHLKHIYSKLAVTSRLHAIAIARDLGLIE